MKEAPARPAPRQQAPRKLSNAQRVGEVVRAFLLTPPMRRVVLWIVHRLLRSGR